jgi:hypothetical protein
MVIDMDKLETSETRAKFTSLTDKLGIRYLNISEYFLEGSMGEQVMRMMMTKTKAIARVYMIEGFNFS